MTNIFKMFVIGILLLTAAALFQDIYKKAQNFEEIGKVEKQAGDLEKQNKVLKESVEKSQIPLSLEKQARDKLGYQKPGETLYVTDLGQQAGKNEKKREDNWQGWVKLFLN